MGSSSSKDQDQANVLVIPDETYSYLNQFSGKDWTYEHKIELKDHRLIAVQGYSGDYLQAIQFLFMEEDSGSLVMSPYFGRYNGDGTKHFQWSLNPKANERINHIYIASGDLIDCIAFNDSQLFGGEGGEKRMLIRLHRMNVVGVHIRYRYQYIQGLKFILK